MTDVYIRKQGNRSLSGDDALGIESIAVTLLGIEPERRVYRADKVALGNEFGHQVWLPMTEMTVPGTLIVGELVRGAL